MIHWYKQQWVEAGYEFDDEQLRVLWRLGLSVANHKSMVIVILAAYSLGKGGRINGLSTMA